MILSGIAIFILGAFMVGVDRSGEASGAEEVTGTPPIAGIGDRYLGENRVVWEDGKTSLTIPCKMGYDSVIVFPGREVKKIFLGGYSWSGSVSSVMRDHFETGRDERGVFGRITRTTTSVVVLDPPATLPVSTNLVVVFNRGIAIFRLKVVAPDKPFLARTVVRFRKGQPGQRLK